MDPKLAPIRKGLLEFLLLKIFAMTSGCSMLAMILSLPAQPDRPLAAAPRHGRRWFTNLAIQSL